MIKTIDTAKYRVLVAEVLPRRIETEEENEYYLSIVEKLFKKGSENFTPEEDKLFDLLTMLIEDFEDKAYPMGDVQPAEMIKFILEQRGIKQKDLLPVFGSEGVISDILNGRRSVTLKTAQKLAQFFNVSVELFV